jgi:exodeoxyribonuclease X
MQTHTLIFLDTETTGNTPDDVLCQLAYAVDGGDIFCELYNPGKKIPPEASAVTHITNKMVRDKLAFKSASEYPAIKTLLEADKSVVVAHNAKFDVGMLAHDAIVVSRPICTLRVARFLDPENKIPRYNLQYLRYYLEMELDAPAHDARGDVLVLMELFERLYVKLQKLHPELSRDTIVEKMREISSTPSLMHSFTFGKHIGKTVSDVATHDRGYLEWMLAQKQQSEADEEDWIYTLNYYLGKL